MSQDIYNTIPRPDEIKLFDQSKIDKTVREIAAIMIDPEQLAKYNRANRNGDMKLTFDITSYRLSSVEKERLCEVFRGRGWTTSLQSGSMLDQGSTYLLLTEA